LQNRYVARSKMIGAGYDSHFSAFFGQNGSIVCKNKHMRNRKRYTHSGISNPPDRFLNFSTDETTAPGYCKQTIATSIRTAPLESTCLACIGGLTISRRRRPLIAVYVPSFPDYPRLQRVDQWTRASRRKPGNNMIM
jgi:hypothetical protein